MWDLDDLDGVDWAAVNALKDELEEAIRIDHYAVKATPDDHPERGVRLNRLAKNLYKLHLRTNAMSDLEEAVCIGQAAVDATPEDGAERTECLGCLGATLYCRFHRTASLDDLEKSIRLAQASVHAMTENCPGRATPLHNLGAGYRSLFLETRSLKHLEEAIRYGQDAVDAAKAFLGPSDQAPYLDSLERSFHERYQQTASADDLDNAILTGQAAISTTSEDDPQRAKRLRNLASGFWARARRTGSVDDQQEAFTLFTEALYQSSSPELDCLLCGIEAAYIASDYEQYDQGAQYLTECLHLLPKTVPRSNSHEDLQYILRMVSGLGSLAASVFLRAGKSAFDSLQALEMSRGIISSFMIDSRSDVSMLEEGHPDLWSEYCYLRDSIAKSTLISAGLNSATLPLIPGEPLVPEAHYPLITLARRIMVKELEAIKGFIRTNPELERFQLPPTKAELHGLARNGPIVSFNVTRFGSHAFLITDQNVRVMPLPRFVLKDIHEHVSQDMGGNRSRRDGELVSTDEDGEVEGESQSSTRADSMRWLWEVAVKPVLQELGLLWQYKPPPVLPCLGWVGGGLTSLLPLHAAGDHQLGSTENTMSHIVSSYAPSLKVLQFSQKKTWTPPTTEGAKILIITMHKTRGHADLNVKEEVAAIQKHVGSSATIEVLETPWAETVLERVTACSLVHFACHGTSDFERPSKSALLLGKNVVEKLTIGDLQSLNHPLAQVAYLSACSTAEIGARSLIDESINLATTFQLSGFRHVIGTLWGAFDSAAAAVAAKFYEYLLQQKTGTISPVARALHQAILDLKANNGNGDNISLWAPFIHVGP